MHNILIITDGSLREGIGHISRSSTISDLFINSGNRVSVLCGPDPAIRPVTFNSRTEIITTYQGNHLDLKGPRPNIILSDLPPERDRAHISEYAMRHGIFHVSINDLMLSNGSYDLCINPSIVPSNKTEEKTFSGPRFAILNRRVTDMSPPVQPPPNKKAKKIFISMGGTDPGGLTELILVSLLDKTPRDVRFFVVSTRLSPETCEFKKSFKNLHIENDPEKFGFFLRSSDIAIVSGGITLYECCFSGVPAIVIPQNCFQERTAEAFQEKNAAVLIKSGDISTPDSVAAAFKKLARDFNLRSKMSNNGRALIDGKGAKRVVELILGSYSNFRDRS